MVGIDLHRLVSLFFRVVPEVGPGRFENAGARDVDVRDGGEVLQRGSVEAGQVLPGSHIAFLELDLGGVGGHEGFCFGCEFEVTDEDAGAAGVGEFGEGEADTWALKSVERRCSPHSFSVRSGYDQGIRLLAIALAEVHARIPW